LAAAKALPLTAKAATRAIRDRAADSANVVLTDHAQERMIERDITAPEVFRILRDGTVHERPVLTEAGDWKAAVEMWIPGGGDVAVVAVIRKGSRLVVVTVMWRDQR
jgi:hypothetical protein